MRIVRAGGIALALAAELWSPARAAAAERPRISIAGVRGDTGGKVAAELARALCTENACVPAARVRRAGKLDFGAVKAEHIAGVLFGTVTRARGAPRLELALLTTSLTPQRRWAFQLDRRGRLPASALASVAAELGAALGAGGPAVTATPAPAAARAPAARPPPGSSEVRVAGPAVVESGHPAPIGARAAAAEGVRPRARVPASPEPPAPVAVGTEPSTDLAGFASRVRRVNIELGGELTRRSLSYSGGSAPRTYQADAIWSPAVRIEVAPWAAGEPSWYRGATAFGAYSRSIGLETTAPTTSSRRHATDLTQLDAGAGLWFQPLTASRALARVRVSYRLLSLEVKPSGGSGIDGLPDANLAGPSAGLDLELPVASRWAILVGASYTRWLRARDLVGGAGFYGDGSAWAVEVGGGLSVALHPNVSVRVLADWQRTQYTLSGSTVYGASSAVDGYLTFRAVLRAGY